jgi:hypothetical protein
MNKPYKILLVAQQIFYKISSQFCPEITYGHAGELLRTKDPDTDAVGVLQPRRILRRRLPVRREDLSSVGINEKFTAHHVSWTSLSR